MRLIDNLYSHFCEKACRTRVSHMCIGLRYTVVTTDDGGIGIAYTYQDGGRCCPKGGYTQDFENGPAIQLLEQIKSPVPLNRSMGLALVNALNFDLSSALPDDPKDSVWMESLGIGPKTRVAMVGFFRPLMRLFDVLGARVEVLDDHQGVGDRDRFFKKLEKSTDVLVLTATSILNDSTEKVLDRLAPGAKTIVLGPSTPMVREAFGHLPVHVLAGTVPVEKENVLKAVRHGEEPLSSISSAVRYT